jgi:spore germination protein YaaH
MKEQNQNMELLDNAKLEEVNGGIGLGSPLQIASGLSVLKNTVGSCLYTVKEGDTLTSIAEAHNVDVKVLAALNFQHLGLSGLLKGIRYPTIQSVADYIFPGQTIIIPKLS